MSLIPQRSLLGASSRTSEQYYVPTRSVLFDSEITNYLYKTFAGSQSVSWAFSAWVKRGKRNATNTMFSSVAYQSSTSPSAQIYFSSDDRLCFQCFNGTSYPIQISSTDIFRDNTSWYHIMVVCDTQNVTDSERIRMYVNNRRITSFYQATWPTQNSSVYFNESGWQHNIGGIYYNNSLTNKFDGQMCEINFLDQYTSKNLTPSDFGQINPYTNQWSPKLYKGSYAGSPGSAGANSWYLGFKYASTLSDLGRDNSPANKTTPTYSQWVVSLNGIDYNTTRDIPVISPSSDGVYPKGNYAILMDTNASADGLKRAGQVYDNNGTASWYGITSSQAMTSGKWYVECYPYTYGKVHAIVGISKPWYQPPANANYYVGNNAFSWGYNAADGGIYYNATKIATYSTFGYQIRIGIAMDLDTGKVWFRTEGVWQGGGNPETGTNPTLTIPVGAPEDIYTFAFGVHDNSIWVNFGSKNYTYPPPTGFKSVCTSNFTEPQVKKTNTAMDTILYAGSGTTNYIGNGVLNPGMFIIKNRTNTSQPSLIDKVRGAGYKFITNTPAAQSYNDANGYATAISGAVVTLNAGGNDTNALNSNYVAWMWAAGESTVTNNDGSVQTTVCANPDTGFSIVQANMTGPGGSVTLGHGLNKKPAFMIHKPTAASNFSVYHQRMGPQYYTLFDGTAGAATNSTARWNATSPTDKVFSLGSDWTVSPYTHMAYCWSEIEGYSRFGSYVGNGNSNGPFIHCGFRPKWVMYRAYDSAEGWLIVDDDRNVYNPTQNYLVPSTTQAENSTPIMDFFSTGFKLRIAGAWGNGLNVTYLYAAFAECPSKYSLAR